MTREEIVDMAKKCGWDNPATNMMPLYQFAKLVATHERESCAKLCDEANAKHVAEQIREKDQRIKTKDIGPLLKKKREELKLNQQEVALIIGCSRVSICQWETGRSNPPLEHFLPLLSLYNMKIDESF
jgi:DNA-binding XRE family transcriptional regulator